MARALPALLFPGLLPSERKSPQLSSQLLGTAGRQHGAYRLLVTGTPEQSRGGERRAAGPWQQKAWQQLKLQMSTRRPFRLLDLLS